jgi:hypothetical protein
MKYNKAIGFPDSIFIPKYKIHLFYSNHATDKINQFGMCKYPIDIQLTIENIVELDTVDGKKIDNVVVRLPYNNTEGIVLSLMLFKRTAVVKTIWLNNINDTHQTLDKSKYDIPDNYNSKEIDQIYAGK